MKIALIAISALLVVGCAGPAKPRPEPEIIIKEVKVATPVPCKALADLGPEPVYPDTAEAIEAAQSISEVSRLYAKGRLLRVQRLAEYSAARLSCTF